MSARRFFPERGDAASSGATYVGPLRVNREGLKPSISSSFCIQFLDVLQKRRATVRG